MAMENDYLCNRIYARITKTEIIKERIITYKLKKNKIKNHKGFKVIIHNNS